MGRYGNQIGYHTVEMTTSCMKLLQDAGFIVKDTSWHNDAVDSLGVEIGDKLWLVFIANSKNLNPNNDEWNIFTILDDENYGTGEGYIEKGTMVEVIAHLNELKRELEQKESEKIIL